MKKLLIAMLILGMTGASFGAFIDFTGGTVTQWNGTTSVTTNGPGDVRSVDYYEEAGFRLDFIVSNPPPSSFTSIVGDYYNVGNDVIHGHWNTGSSGSLTEIRVTKIDGTAFDLNYFVIASNTDQGGGPASGNELTYINASTDGTTISHTQLLPTDDWGLGAGPDPQVWLGSQFDNILYFSFTVGNSVNCFGMDNFYIDEEGPVIPAPGALLLGSMGMGIVGWLRRRRMV